MLQTPFGSTALRCVLRVLFLLRPQEVLLAVGGMGVRSHFLLRTRSPLPDWCWSS